MKSIIQKDTEHCLICKRHKSADYFGLDKHHIFYAYNRTKSEKYGLFAFICHDNCHLNGVHKNHELDLRLKQYAQRKAMKYYNWSIDDFRKIFGKNYLDTEE
jgi:hypothetical protein